MIRFEARANVWIVTDRFGFIVDATAAVSDLFGVSHRQLLFRELLTFFDRPLPVEAFDRLLPGSRLSHAVAIQRANGTLVPAIVEIADVEEWEQGKFRQDPDRAQSPPGYEHESPSATERDRICHGDAVAHLVDVLFGVQ
jgi:PAS domain-containing protein